MTDAREKLEEYAASVPDHVVLNFTHGAYSPKAFAALRAVLDVHQPRDYDGWIGARLSGRVQCGHCADNCHSHSGIGCEDPVDAMWPCETVKAISEALAGEGE